jgi:hypothetical protein
MTIGEFGRYLLRDPYKYSGVMNWHFRVKLRMILGGTCDAMKKFLKPSHPKSISRVVALASFISPKQVRSTNEYND